MQIGLNSYYQANCPAKDGCPSDLCPDFNIKRYDTKPPFKVMVEDCNGAFDLTDENLLVEVNIWSKSKLKKDIAEDATYFQLADNIGFEQILVGDIIIVDRVRLPEHMLVTGFDENNHLVQVQRGYNGTSASVWKKGTVLRSFRTLGVSGSIENVTGDVEAEDGTVTSDVLMESYLVYEWSPQDVCTPGCYWLEFKLIKMEEEEESVDMLSHDTISNISFTPEGLSYTDFGCFLGAGVEWVRRFPSESEGFLIKIEPSYTAEI